MDIGQGPKLQGANLERQHRDQLSKPAGRNAAEREYLVRLEAIRRQNFQERRNIVQRNNRAPIHPKEVAVVPSTQLSLHCFQISIS
jgi:hypothetical protein